MALRLMMLGIPKAGKSSCLAAAANSGWTIRYLDFDGNADPIFAHTTPANRKNIQVVSCLDPLGIVEGPPSRDGKPGHISYGFNAENKPRGWKTLTDAMNKWPVDGSDPRTWDPFKNVLVVDSLTTASEARMRLVRYVSGSRFGFRNFRDYMLSQEDIIGFIGALKVHIPCPVIVMAHIQTISPDVEVELDESIEEGKRGPLLVKMIEMKLKEAEKTPPVMGPVSVGRAQVKTLAAHFNGVVLVEALPSSDRRVIRTKPIDGLNLGLPFAQLNGKDVPRELDISTGLAAILKEWVSIQTSTEAQKDA